MKQPRRKFMVDTAKAAIGSGLVGSTFNTMQRSSRFSPSFITNNSDDTINIGVIGTGGRGQNLISNIAAIDGLNVIACCDLLPFRLEKAIASTNGMAKGYEDYRQLLEHSGLDAVIVATPLNTHFEVVKDSLDANKHVYCEKTMTFTLEETKELELIVHNSNRTFQVGYQHRYNPIYQKVREYIQGEEFGPLSHIECYWNRNGDWRRPVPDPKFERAINWRMYREYSGGLMAELSSHQLNIVNWMMGTTPLKVMGTGGIDYWKDGRETFDNIHALFEYPDGLKVSCTSLTTNADRGFRMNFYGKNATIQLVRGQGYQAHLLVEPTYYQSLLKGSDEVDGASGATAQLVKGEPMLIHQTEPGKEDAIPTQAALASFAHCIRNDEAPKVGYESGRDSAICVALANKAMQTGEVVHWKDYV